MRRMSDVEVGGIDMRRLALMGARARIIEIDEERARLIEMFPELQRAKPGRSKLSEKREQPEQREQRRKAPEPIVIFDAVADGKKKRKQRWFKPDEKAAAVARVKAGEYAVDVARSLDINSTVLAHWCKAAKVKPRLLPPAEKERRRLEGYNAMKGKTLHNSGPDIRTELLRRVAAGEQMKAVARELGVTYPTAKGWKRGRGAARPSRQGVLIGKRLTKEERVNKGAEVARLVDAGATIRGAAKQLGIPGSSAQKLYAAWVKSQRNNKSTSNGVQTSEG